MNRTEQNRRIITGQAYREEAEEGQLYGHTLDSLVSVVKFKDKGDYNAILVIHGDDNEIKDIH